jgi:hypothetical protein
MFDGKCLKCIVSSSNTSEDILDATKWLPILDLTQFTFETGEDVTTLIDAMYGTKLYASSKFAQTSQIEESFANVCDKVLNTIQYINPYDTERYTRNNLLKDYIVLNMGLNAINTLKLTENYTQINNVINSLTKLI